MFPQVYNIIQPVVQEALSDDGDMEVDSLSFNEAYSKTMSAPFLLQRHFADGKTRSADVQGPVRSKPWPTHLVHC